MAGDWIPIRTDLSDDPAVIGIAEAVGLDQDHVVGKLVRLWVWVDRHLVDGNAPGVTEKWIERYTGVTGFGAAMVEAGWLEVVAGGVRIPNHDRWFSQSSKRRLLTSRRVASHRQRKCNASGVTKALPQYSTEEKIQTTSVSKGRTRRKFVPPTVEEVRVYCGERSNSVDPQAFVDFYEANGWVQGKAGKPIRDWKAAVRTWENSRKQGGLFSGRANQSGARYRNEGDAAATPYETP